MHNFSNARLNRLFHPSGNCLNVAIDHGVFNERSFLTGLENMGRVVAELVDAGPDALQMNYGQADLLQSIPGKSKPALVMRLDAGNPYSAHLPTVPFDILVRADDPVLPAVQMDAACVVCNLLLFPGDPDLHRQTVANVGKARAECDRYGMPLMVEPLVMKFDEARGAFQSDGNKNLIVPLVRQARELGADVIKADPTDDPADYHEVIQAARCPLLVRGGGREPVETVFRKAHALLRQGAHGLVYGRNIYQHAHPSVIVKAFLGMLHDGLDGEQAWALYREHEQAS
ncbi:MAG TPA: aldolase [Bryobacteraceae bacterium]|nr:aldolase [Bryobacteraceae bacterium]